MTAPDDGLAALLAEHWSASTHTDRKPYVDKCDGCGAVILEWGQPVPSDSRLWLAAHQAAVIRAAGWRSEVEIAKAQRESFREGYRDAREDIMSGAFIGGPNYEAFKATFAGRKAMAEAYDAGYERAMSDHYGTGFYDKSKRINPYEEEA